MRRIISKSLIALATIGTLLHLAVAQEESGWISLFDGKTLDGWAQLNGTATYVVKDGAIVGKTAAGSPNSFLCSKKTFGDFELEFDVKVDPGLNSGVQLRSRQKTAEDIAALAAEQPKGKSQPAADAQTTTPSAQKAQAGKAKAPANKNSNVGRVFGPQIEIECGPKPTDRQSGFIYGEATAFGWLSQEPKSKDPKVSERDFMKTGDWNLFRVIAKGPRIQTWINGQPVADLTHEEIYKSHPSGFIGLQVHANKSPEPLYVAWRNIRIRELK